MESTEMMGIMRPRPVQTPTYMCQQQSALMNFYSQSYFRDIPTRHQMQQFTSANSSTPQYAGYSQATRVNNPSPSQQYGYYDNNPLQTLQTNPMFGDLQRTLVAEVKTYNCRQMTNNMNIHRQNTPIHEMTTTHVTHTDHMTYHPQQQAQQPIPQNDKTIVVRHEQLQMYMKNLMMDRSIQTSVMKMEEYYNCEVSTIEMARYQAVCASSTENYIITGINLCFDRKRLQLIDSVSAELEKIQVHRRRHRSVESSPLSDGSGSKDFQPSYPESSLNTPADCNDTILSDGSGSKKTFNETYSVSNSPVFYDYTDSVSSSTPTSRSDAPLPIARQLNFNDIPVNQVQSSPESSIPSSDNSNASGISLSSEYENVDFDFAIKQTTDLLEDSTTIPNQDDPQQHIVEDTSQTDICSFIDEQLQADLQNRNTTPMPTKPVDILSLAAASVNLDKFDAMYSDDDEQHSNVNYEQQIWSDDNSNATNISEQNTVYDTQLFTDDNSTSTIASEMSETYTVYEPQVTSTPVLDFQQMFSTPVADTQEFYIPPTDVTPAQFTMETTMSSHSSLTDVMIAPLAIETAVNQSPTETVYKGRGSVSDKAVEIMSIWYQNHVTYPYPTDSECAELCKQCNLKKNQVKKWMANKRVRNYNTLSITGNKHPIKIKFEAGEIKASDKNKYTQLSEESREVLNRWYELHAAYPYPTEEEKVELSQAANVSMAQIKSWFANKRSRAVNTKKQIPNYFIKKFPEFSPMVQMIGQNREEARRNRKRGRTTRKQEAAPY